MPDGVKFCGSCKMTKPASEFHRRSSRPSGLQTRCKHCVKKRDEERLATPGMKEHKRLLDAQSHNVKRRRAYMRSEKGKAAWLKYDKSQRGQLSNFQWRLKSLYGLSVEEYEAKFKRQLGCCAICKKPWLGGRRLGVDHNHTTSTIRSLLCSSCNLIVGHAMESLEILESAKDYLEQWQRIEQIKVSA